MLKAIKETKWWFYIPYISPILFTVKIIKWSFDDEENFHNRHIIGLCIFTLNATFSVVLSLIIYLKYFLNL